METIVNRILFNFIEFLFKFFQFYISPPIMIFYFFWGIGFVIGFIYGKNYKTIVKYWKRKVKELFNRKKGLKKC